MKSKVTKSKVKKVATKKPKALKKKYIKRGNTSALDLSQSPGFGFGPGPSPSPDTRVCATALNFDQVPKEQVKIQGEVPEIAGSHMSHFDMTLLTALAVAIAIIAAILVVL